MAIIVVVSFNSTQLKQQTANELPEIATSEAVLGRSDLSNMLETILMMKRIFPRISASRSIVSL